MPHFPLRGNNHGRLSYYSGLFDNALFSPPSGFFLVSLSFPNSSAHVAGITSQMIYLHMNLVSESASVTQTQRLKKKFKTWFMSPIRQKPDYLHIFWNFTLQKNV